MPVYAHAHTGQPFARMGTCMYVLTHACVQACTCTHTHMFVVSHVCINVHMGTRNCTGVWAHAHARAYGHTHVRTCTRTQACRRTYSHTYTWTCTYLHTHILKDPCQIEEYGIWVVKIFRKFIFTTWDLNEKPLLIHFQQLKCECLHKN